MRGEDAGFRPAYSKEMTNTYRIADTVIQICSLHERVHRLCSNYRTDDVPADICITVTQSDIDDERAHSYREKQLNGLPVIAHSDSYMEELAVYRKIAEKVPFRDIVLMHGSCVAVDGEGYLFIAKSGTGKSTHTRLWRELFGDRAVMINDDKPLIRIADDGAMIYGTPWSGKHHLETNCSVPLKAICILERAEENTIHRMNAAEAYPFLLQQIYRPQDGAAMLKTMHLTDRLSQKVGLWRLGCNMDVTAAQVAYEAMKGSDAE